MLEPLLHCTPCMHALIAGVIDLCYLPNDGNVLKHFRPQTTSCALKSECRLHSAGQNAPPTI